MILDELNEFADAASMINNAGSTYILGDVIDLGLDGLNIGVGEDIFLVVQIATAVEASGGAANVTFSIKSDADVTITDGTTHFATAAIAKGTLIAGYQPIVTRLPAGTYERYLGVCYAPDTNNLTAGAANAFLTKDVAAWKAYANAID